jgi:hypothetical protein
MRGIQLTAGIAPKDGLYAGFAFSQYTRRTDRWLIGVEYLEKRHNYKMTDIPQAQLTLDAGYYLKCLSNWRKTFVVSLGLSAVGGYETVNWNRKLLDDGATIANKDGFLYGGALTLETELYLSNRIVLLAGVRERLLDGSSVGKFQTLAGLGVKIIIN